MSDTSHISHSEAIAGVRVKRFLTLAVMKLSQELLRQSKSDETIKFLEKTLTDLVKSSFILSSSDNPSAQAKLFLASLGFSPCEIEWVEDVRLGKILLGRSRLWKATTDEEDQLIRLLLSAVVKGIGFSFIDANVEVSFPEKELLPPRFSYEIHFRASEDVFAETFHKEKEEKSEVTLSAGSLLEPVLGTGVQVQEATHHLIEGARTVVEEHFPEILKRTDIETYPLKILEVLFLNFQEDEKAEIYANKIGELMVKGIRQANPDLKNHHILKGIGLLPPEEIDELLFYAPIEMCGSNEKSAKFKFCKFLGHIWAGFASEVLGRKYRMLEDPLCSGMGSNCIFTIEEEKK
ncbi:MAG: hypothetical protein ACTSR2_05705 [Candidatus Hodarchaeales archaeon]